MIGGLIAEVHAENVAAQLALLVIEDRSLHANPILDFAAIGIQAGQRWRQPHGQFEGNGGALLKRAADPFDVLRGAVVSPRRRRRDGFIEKNERRRPIDRRSRTQENPRRFYALHPIATVIRRGRDRVRFHLELYRVNRAG